MFRIVTVAREYGSGGGRIAQLLAGRLGWRLLDRCLVEKIADAAMVRAGRCREIRRASRPLV